MRKYDRMQKLDDNENFNCGSPKHIKFEIVTSIMILWTNLIGECKIRGKDLKIEETKQGVQISGKNKTYYMNFFRN